MVLKLGLAVAVLAERLAAPALEVQRRGVHEHNRQVAEQVAPASKQPFLDEVLDAAWNQRPPGLLGRRQFLTKPDHRAIEMMQLQLIDAIDAVVVSPILASAVGARHHEAVQHGQEHRALDRKLEPAPGQQFFHHGATATVAPWWKNCWPGAGSSLRSSARCS